MPSGGKRSTSWASSWKSGKTKRVRLPIAIADTVIEIAHQIDEGEIDPVCRVPRQNDDLFACPKAKIEGAIALLEESLTLKANAGGKIKTKVREALKILAEET